MSDTIAATARVAALSDRLLTKNQVERMVSAENFDEAFRMLYDLSWAQDIDQESDFEQILENGLYDIKKSIQASELNDNLLKGLFLPFDLQNAKLSLAAFRQGKTYEEIRSDLSSLGFYERAMSFRILEGGYGDSFLQKSLQKAQKEEDIQEAEHQLDVAFFRVQGDALGQDNDEDLQDFFRLQVEKENVKKLVRTQEESIALLFPQEKAGEKKMSRIEAEQHLSFSSLKPFLQKGLVIAQNKTGLTAWEIELEVALIDQFFWKGKISPLSPLQIFLFLSLQLRNAEIIRSILVGKKNGFSQEEIRHMISPFLPSLTQ